MISFEDAKKIVEANVHYAGKKWKVIGGEETEQYYMFGVAPIDWDGDPLTLPVNSMVHCVDKETSEYFEKHIIDILMEDLKAEG